MKFAVRLLILCSTGAGAFAATRYLATHRESASAAATAASLSPAASESATPAPPAVADRDANAPSPPLERGSGAGGASDVAARVNAAYAAGKAKADAEKSGDRPELPLAEVIRRSLPAVVRVETAEALGTGFFIAPDTILTNVHVVGNRGIVTIRRTGGATEQARVATTAPELDIAVLKTATANTDQPTLAMGSSSRAHPGEEVVALGSPLGLTNTVTRGIVSAVRQVGGLTLVQTDAAINPGNSGGPLVDRTGEVVGITTLGMRSAVAQGLSFAIAIDHARDLVAGNRPSGASGTPLSTLSEAMAGRGRRSEAESARERAAQAYEQAVAATARRADALDEQWPRFVRSCYAGAIAGSFSRPWFALFDPRAMQGAVAPGCATSFDEFRAAAAGIRTAIVSLDEAARQADVYPGTRRDVLRRFRLDNPDWVR